MTYTIPSYTITPGTVYQPPSSGTTITYPLDPFAANVVFAMSSKRLLTNAPANIIRGRDATTNEEDFTATGLAAGIVTLADGGDAFIPTAYDQSGNGNHATQTTAANQPKMVDTGTLLVDGSGRPVMEFDGVNDYLTIPVAVRDIVTANNSWTVFWFMNPTLPGSGTDVVWDSTNGSSNRVQVEVTSGGVLACTTYDGSFSNASGPVSSGVEAACALVSNAGALSLYIDGILQIGASGSTTTAGTNFNIGANSTGVNSFSGKQNNFIVFNRVLTASEVATLHASLS